MARTSRALSAEARQGPRGRRPVQVEEGREDHSLRTLASWALASGRLHRSGRGRERCTNAVVSRPSCTRTTGTSTWRDEWAAFLDDFGVVYFVVEPDSGGETLSAELATSPLRDRLRFISLAPYKDVSELHIANPEGFRAAFDAGAAGVALCATFGPPTNYTPGERSPEEKTCAIAGGRRSKRLFAGSRTTGALSHPIRAPCRELPRLPRPWMHHSDQGCQYTSIAFGARCAQWGVRPSMGSVGDAYDNAMAESFFATLECELLDRHRFNNQYIA